MMIWLLTYGVLEIFIVVSTSHAIRCPALQMTGKMDVVPNECSTVGGQYNKICQVYCTSGYKLIGVDEFLCMANGTYDGSLNNTKCIEEEKLQCPNDVIIELPLGASKMTLPLEKLSIKLDPTKVETEPPGVLTGEYRFKSSPLSQMVKVKSKFIGLTGTCNFFVTVIDKEPPVVRNCPEYNVYFTFHAASTGFVSWPEPTFTDNVNITTNFANLKNNQVRGEQVYYVYYSAADAFNNEAVCSFFVIVKGMYCSAENMPGGDGITPPIIYKNGFVITALVRCIPGLEFARNITKIPGYIFKCPYGEWEDIPDCVPVIPKTGNSCPAGHIVIQKQLTKEMLCAKCPKGTEEYNGECVKCSVGMYQDKFASTRCIMCPPDTRTISNGQKDKSSCQRRCQPGEYSHTGLSGSHGCLKCPNGTYQSYLRQTSCKVCPIGGTSPKGSRTEHDCKLPAYISRIFPESQIIKAKIGDNVTIDCYGSGSPLPRMKIENVGVVSDSSRTKRQISPTPSSLLTGNKYISGIRLTITVITKQDESIYKCIADNKNGRYGGIDTREVILRIEI